MSRKIDWFKYKIRICRWMHECIICHQTIRDGQPYFDGGIDRRAHKECAEKQRTQEFEEAFP